MNILLVSSIAVRCFWNILERLMHMAPSHPTLFNMCEFLEMLGMSIATLICDRHFVDISLLILALSITLIAIRLKSYLGVLNFMCIIIMASVLYFPKILQIRINPFGLIVFLVRLAFEPLIDLYFVGLTLLERWEPFLCTSTFLRRIVILGVLVIEVRGYFIREFWGYFILKKIGCPPPSDFFCGIDSIGAIPVQIYIP